MGFCSVAGVQGDVLLGQNNLTSSGVDLTTLQIGDSLTFEMVTGPKGYHATNIQVGGQRVTGKIMKIGDRTGFCFVKGIPGDVLFGERSLAASGLDLKTL